MSAYGLIARYKGRRGLVYHVRVGKYHYTATSAREAIVARQNLYHATILDGHYKGALQMEEKRLPLNARLQVAQMKELGFMIYIKPGLQEEGIYVMNEDGEYGPFSRTDTALMGYIKMLQNDLDDMTEACYREITKGTEEGQNDCEDCEGTTVCYYCGGIRTVRHETITDMWIDCPSCQGYGICNTCKGYVP